MTSASIDAAWLLAHPLPVVERGADKNARGRVLVAGGAEFVPGALRLTGEAALRAGAGKLQMATVRSAALSLGVLIPEAAMIALPAQEDGEIAAEAVQILAKRISACDALIVGPGMSVSKETDELVAGLLSATEQPCAIILDAAALTSIRDLASLVRAHQGRVILTPHHGEAAILSGRSEEAIAADPETTAADMALQFGAVVLLKGKVSVVASPDGASLIHDLDCVGLATGGSGDVLAGLVGGLCARGASPAQAAAWAIWVHGHAGQRLSREIGPVGFLARELLPLIPALLHEGARGEE